MNHCLLFALCLLAAGCSRPGPADAGGDAGWNLEPGTDISVEITGRGFLWHYRYAGPDGVMGSADDILASGDLHLPANVNATVFLKSDDYIYTLAVPHLGVHTAAIPELTMTSEFGTDAAGVFELLGDQMCGYQHEDLIVRLYVEPQDRFKEWASSIQETHDL